MSISVECHCGERLSVPSDLAGKRYPCPVCQANLEVPSEETAHSEESAYRAEAICKCPKCRKEWPNKTAVCIECGYNFRTGKKLKTIRKVRDRYVDLGKPFLGSYSRYSAPHRQ